MPNKSYILNRTSEINNARLIGFREDKAIVLRTDWQSILDEINKFGVGLNVLVNSQGTPNPIEDILLKYKNKCALLKVISDEFNELYDTASRRSTHPEVETASRLLKSIKAGWRAAVHHRHSNSKKEQSIQAKANAKEKKDRLAREYEYAKKWLDKNQNTDPAFCPAIYMAFSNAISAIDSIVDTLSESDRNAVLDLIKSHCFARLSPESLKTTKKVKRATTVG